MAKTPSRAPPLLSRLHEIDREASKRFPGPFDRGLGCLGLKLDKSLDQSRYPHCTPANSITFANTGGDGTHFGLLEADGRLTDSSPVVLTVPSAFGTQHHIVGESLFDFLCLGSRRGYFALEQLAYDRETTIEAYCNPDWHPIDKSQLAEGFWLGQNYRTAFVAGEGVVDVRVVAILKFLVDPLHLHPWTDRTKFDALADRFESQLAPPVAPIE